MNSEMNMKWNHNIRTYLCLQSNNMPHAIFHLSASISTPTLRYPQMEAAAQNFPAQHPRSKKTELLFSFNLVTAACNIFQCYTANVNKEIKEIPWLIRARRRTYCLRKDVSRNPQCHLAPPHLLSPVASLANDCCHQWQTGLHLNNNY